MSRRTERVGNVVQRELSQYIQREINDPRLGFLTISRVELASDLGLAKVSVSVMGTEKERHDTLEVLTEFASRMRGLLAKALHTRVVPRIVFELDRNLDHGFRIDSLLREIEHGRNPSLKADLEEEREERKSRDAQGDPDADA